MYKKGVVCLDVPRLAWSCSGPARICVARQGWLLHTTYLGILLLRTVHKAHTYSLPERSKETGYGSKCQDVRTSGR